MSRNRRGNAMLEFTLVGIPLTFVLISTVEMARGMWLYHTMAYAIKEAVRYASVHGTNCATSANNCALQIKDIASVIQNAGVGLDPALLQVTFVSSTRTIGPKSLQQALSDSTYWPTYAAGTTPPDGGGNPPLPLTIAGNYPFFSAISMFWPGAPGQVFGTFNLPATSTELIHF